MYCSQQISTYPCRYIGIVLFGGPVPQLSMIFSQTIDMIDSNHNHRLNDLNQGWLSPRCLTACADSVHRKGGALDNVSGFIHETVCHCCRPKVNQRILYNEHKRLHALKYQSATTPNGMIANLFGLVEDKRHVSTFTNTAKIFLWS